ncbi:MAG: S41 family peptidase [Chloroflexota bacterium]
MYEQPQRSNGSRLFSPALFFLGFILLPLATFVVGYFCYPLIHRIPIFPADFSANQTEHRTIQSNASLQNHNIDNPPNSDNAAPPLADNVDHESLKESEVVDSLQLYREVEFLLDRDFYGTQPDQQTQVYAAVKAMVATYEDPYTVFVEPQPREIERDQLRGSFGGVGAYIETTQTGYTLRPMPDQPADVAGIEAGDLLIGVDSQPISIGIPINDVVALIRGPIDTQVELTVQRIEQDEHDATEVQNSQAITTQSITTQSITTQLSFSVTRAVIQTPSLEWRMFNVDDTSGEHQDAVNALIEEMQTNSVGENAVDLVGIEYPSSNIRIGYMKHTIFSERSPAEMRDAIDELTAAGANRFIWDLRGNPGGIVNVAVEMTDMWLETGVVLIEEYADGSDRTLEATEDGMIAPYPLVLVVDGGTASASEIVAGSLQDHQRAILVGEKTFGKGSVQYIHELSDQSSLHVTTAHWFTPEYKQINQQGLTPDVVLEPGMDPIPHAIVTLLSTE